mgnify:CR=1 FL=1
MPVTVRTIVSPPGKLVLKMAVNGGDCIVALTWLSGLRVALDELSIVIVCPQASVMSGKLKPRLVCKLFQLIACAEPAVEITHPAASQLPALPQEAGPLAK